MNKYQELLKRTNGSTLDKNILDRELLLQLTNEGISQNKIVKLFGFKDYEFRQLLVRFGLDKESQKNKYIDEVCNEFGEQVRRAMMSCSYYERHKKVSNRKKEAVIDEAIDIIENVEDYIAKQVAIYGEELGEHLRAIANFENRAAHLKAQADKEDCLRWATADDLAAIKVKIKTAKNIVREPHTKDERTELELTELLYNRKNKVAVYGFGGDVWGYAVIIDGQDKSLEILDFVVFYKEIKLRPTPGMLLKKIDEYANESGVYSIKYKMESIEGLDKSFKVNKYDFQKLPDGESHLLKITSPIGEKYFADLAIEKERQRLIEKEQARIRHEKYLSKKREEDRIKNERIIQTYRLYTVKVKGPESYVETRRRVFIANDGSCRIPPTSDIFKMLIVNQGDGDAIEKIWRLLTPLQMDTLLNIDNQNNEDLAKLFGKSTSSIDKKIVKLGVTRTFGEGLYLHEEPYVYEPIAAEREYEQSIIDASVLLDTLYDD